MGVISKKEIRGLCEPFDKIIEKYDEIFFKWKSWAMGIAGTAVVFAIQEPKRTYILIAAAVAILLFWVMESAYRIVHTSARDAIQCIEDNGKLRGILSTPGWAGNLHKCCVPEEWDKFEIDSISPSNWFAGRDQWRGDWQAWFYHALDGLLKPRVGLPYVLIALSLFFMWNCSPVLSGAHSSKKKSVSCEISYTVE